MTSFLSTTYTEVPGKGFEAGASGYKVDPGGFVTIGDRVYQVAADFSIRRPGRSRIVEEAQAQGPRRAEGEVVNEEERRFWAKVAKIEAGCWRWLAYCDRDGYGRFSDRDRVIVRAHVWLWQRSGRTLAAGFDLGNLCGNRGCVNPDHWKLMARSEVGERSDHHFRNKTHCPAGHLYDEANTYYAPKGGRFCRSCRNEAVAACRRKRAARP